MRDSQRKSTGIIALLFFQLACGYGDDACNCTGFYQPGRKEVCELIREVMTIADATITPMEVGARKHETTIVPKKSKLEDIIDERIKLYLKEYQHDFDIAQKRFKHDVKEVVDIVYSTISDVKKSFESDKAYSFGEILTNVCKEKNFERETLSTTVTYEELKELNVTCPGRDNCEIPRDSDNLQQYNCHCGPICSKLDTCCVDSPFRGQLKEEIIPSCRSFPKEDSYFIVDQCPENGIASNSWKNLCAGEGHTSNFMVLVPVTSLATNITYKNYYCYKCHETGKAFQFWDVKLGSGKELAVGEDGNPMLVFDNTRDIWMASEVHDRKPVKVEVFIQRPLNLSDIVKVCRFGVISSCHKRWKDIITSRKCSEYTSMVNVRNLIYKNPHCALCNFESLSTVNCLYTPYYNISIVKRNVKLSKSYSKFFRFVNFPVSKTCPDNCIWDPFMRECAQLICAEGYILRNETCILS